MVARTDVHLDLSRLHRAHQLFAPNDSTDILVTSLEGLGVELGNRAAAVRNNPGLTPSIRDYGARAGELSSAIGYASDRFTEVMIRRQQIGWMKTALAYETKSDIFTQASDQKAISWRMFMGLAIKDFHIDISSLMDALAPVVILTVVELKPNKVGHLPGWAQIENNQGNPKSSYREQLPDDLRGIVDGANRWWPAVKEVRHLVTHRKHDRIVFGNAEDGILFEVYDGSRSPTILLPQVLYQKGHAVVDFELYSSFVIAEVIALFEDLGTAIAPKMGVSQATSSTMYLRVVDKSVAQSIEHLIQLAGKSDLLGLTQ